MHNCACVYMHTCACAVCVCVPETFETLELISPNGGAILGRITQVVFRTTKSHHQSLSFFIISDYCPLSCLGSMLSPGYFFSSKYSMDAFNFPNLFVYFTYLEVSKDTVHSYLQYKAESLALQK